MYVFAGTGNCVIHHCHIVAWKEIKERRKEGNVSHTLVPKLALWNTGFSECEFVVVVVVIVVVKCISTQIIMN
jgi:hypothetical protein